MEAGLYLEADIDELFYDYVVSSFQGGNRLLVMDSQGGYEHYGFQIKDYIAGFEQSHIHVIGMCASAATFALQGGKKRTASPNARFMIHNPWREARGNADELIEQAQEIRNVENRMVKFYESFLTIKGEELRAFLKEEKVISAQEALSLNLIDEITNLDMSQVQKQSPIADLMNAMKGGFAEIKAQLKGHIDVKALMMSDVNGNELDFGEAITEESQIEVGLTGVTANGEAASGEYTFPNFTIVLEAGEVIEKRMNEAEEEMQAEGVGADEEATDDVVAELKAKISELEGQVNASLKEKEEIQAKYDDLEGVKAKYDDLKGVAAKFEEKNNEFMAKLSELKNASSSGAPNEDLSNSNKHNNASNSGKAKLFTITKKKK